MADAGAIVFTIDKEACAGHGRCYSLAPESFDADDAGYAEVIGRDESARSAEEIQRLVRACPEEAIGINDDAGVVSTA